MDSKSLGVLKLFSKRNSLSCYDIGIILDISPLSVANNVNELRDLGYIDVNNLEELTNNLISIDTKLYITQSGRSYLFDIKDNKKRFILQSIAVPFVVSIISSIITATVTVLLTNK